MMSFEENREMWRRIRANHEEIYKRCNEIRREELVKQGINPDKYINTKKQSNKEIYAAENITVTIIYLLVMIAGTIFVERWLIYIFATIVYFNYITRFDK